MSNSMTRYSIERVCHIYCANIQELTPKRPLTCLRERKQETVSVTPSKHSQTHRVSKNKEIISVKSEWIAVCT